MTSNGIQYGEDIETRNIKSRIKYYEVIQAFPKFENFKNIYLKLRQDGLEEKLYEGINIETVSYDEILEKAIEIEKQFIRPNKDKSFENFQTENESNQNENQNKNIESSLFEDLNETIKNPQTEIKEIKQQEDEKEDDIEDNNVVEKLDEEITYETESNNLLQEQNENGEVNLWMSRFDKWYHSIDNLPVNIKSKYYKMKSDIIKTIKTILKKNNNKNQDNINTNDDESR